MKKKVTRKVKILKDTMAGCKPVKKGQVVEVSEHDATILIQYGKADACD